MTGPEGVTQKVMADKKPTTETKALRSREIVIPLSRGAIRNGYVSVRQHLWFFPKGAISHGSALPPRSCLLDIKGFGRVESAIDGDRGIFRWRGWRRFFAQAELAEGDELVFRKVEPGHYEVTTRRRLLTAPASPSPSADSQSPRARAERNARRCNDLSGDEWLRSSISIWSDIRKSAEELALEHPASFPVALCERLILMFLRRRGKHRVLDPFAGSGSVLVAARNLGKYGIGLDVNESYLATARRRLESPGLFADPSIGYQLIRADARELRKYVSPDTIDLCITSPPYWDILNQRRTADNKSIRNYGGQADDLSCIADYEAFLTALATVFAQVLDCLRPGSYCVVVVMDLRKKDRFFPFHSDLARRLVDIGFKYDDLIIWDRRHEYNSLRPLGYPSVFRVNKVHEYILLFKKPRDRK